MKTKKIMKSLVVVAAMGLMFAGCKKNEDATPTPAQTTDDSNQQAVSASDQSNVESESAKSLDDANSVMDGSSAFRTGSSPCNVTIDSSAKSTGSLKMTFTGNDCDNNRSRSGSIYIQLPYDTATHQVTRWHTAGATATITYVNYKVTNLADNKSLTINGTHSVTNVNGGRLTTLTTGSIIHKVRGNMQLTFDDGTQRTWNIARTRTFSNTAGVLSDEVTGDTTVNNHSNVAMWGTNRAGESFAISITTPVVVNIAGSSCLHKPLSGVRVHHGLARELTVTYGVDANGVAVASGTCPYGFKLNWTNLKGAAKEIIRAY
jgi:hypothetical protein